MEVVFDLRRACVRTYVPGSMMYVSGSTVSSLAAFENRKLITCLHKEIRLINGRII